jgi:enolase
MKIKTIQAYEIFNSRGLPTIECAITLENNQTVTASVPSGASTGSAEVLELYDNDNRLLGKGVQKAVDYINNTIAPLLVNQPINALAMDSILMDLDTSPLKEQIGGNTTLAVSIALFKAQAVSQEIELFKLLQTISGTDQAQLPVPLFNVINGGVHANNNIDIQEFMIIPQEDSFVKNMESGVSFFHLLKKTLDNQKQLTTVGDEGGFAPMMPSARSIFELLKKTAATVSGFAYTFGIDVAASQLYDKQTNTYQWNQETVTAEQLAQIYEQLAVDYPLVLIEDGLAEYDEDGWKQMTSLLGDKISLVGDDIFTTSPMKIRRGILKKMGNAVVIKPNQIGTVSQTLAAIDICKHKNIPFIISHRSAETNDDFISDLAAGTAATYIKAGAPSRGERMAKYNRLLAIERILKNKPAA